LAARRAARRGKLGGRRACHEDLAAGAVGRLPGQLARLLREAQRQLRPADLGQQPLGAPEAVCRDHVCTSVDVLRVDLLHQLGQVLVGQGRRRKELLKLEVLAQPPHALGLQQVAHSAIKHE
jgi:hypothetical protein